MSKSPSRNMVREPAVAGQFYPDSPDALSHEIDSFLEEALVKSPPGNLLGIIVPHAGYVFSGWIAAYGYKILEGKKFDTVILVGLCHRGLDGVSVYNQGGFETPLGLVEVDTDIAKKVIEQNPQIIKPYPQAHLQEHSLEVQIPFLQKTLPKFKIVPILIDESGFSSQLADAVYHAIQDSGKRILLVGSTDLTHYPRYEDAKRVDKSSVDAILSLNPEKLDESNEYWMKKGIPNLHCTVCSEAAVKTVVLTANKMGANHAELLKAANSGDVPIGDKYQVVGYAAIAITQQEKNGKKAPTYEEMEEEIGMRPPDSFELNESAKKELLRVARETLKCCVNREDVEQVTSDHPQLMQELGAFVTLKKGGELRGCIGRFEPDAPVKEIVRDMAIAAALEDPRFNPVTPEELKDIEIEISVLTPRRKIQNIKEIQVGKHGLYLRKGWYAGTLLPQVATEYNWDVDTFLQHTCLKSGLPPDAWKGKDTEIFVYSAIIFHE